MVAPVLAPTVPGVTQTAARWRLEVDTNYDSTDPTYDFGDDDTGDVGDAVWTEVFGIADFSPGAVEFTKADDTDYDSVDESGITWASSRTVGASWKISGVQNAKKYGGVRDPGAAHLEDECDANRPVHVRWFDRFGTKAYRGVGDSTWMPQGGKPTDISVNNFEIAGQGVRHLTVNPVAASSVPDATAASPTTGPVGTEVTITGTNFVGVTGVKFGATAAGLFVVDSTAQIRATVAVGTTTGSKPITVTNAAGDDATTVAFTVT